MNLKLCFSYHSRSDLGFYRDKVSQMQHLIPSLYSTRTYGGENILTFLEQRHVILHTGTYVLHYVALEYMRKRNGQSVDFCTNIGTEQIKRVKEMSCLSVLQITCFILFVLKLIELYFLRLTDTLKFLDELHVFL